MSTYQRNNGIESIKHESVPIKGSSKKNNADFNQPRPTTKWVFEQWKQSQNTTRDQGYIWQNVCQNIHIYVTWILQDRMLEYTLKYMMSNYKSSEICQIQCQTLCQSSCQSWCQNICPSAFQKEYTSEVCQKIRRLKIRQKICQNKSQNIYIYIVIRRSVWTQHMSACENVYMGSSFFSILARCCPIVS